MSSALELKVVFAAVDKFIRPVKAITESARVASRALKESQDRAKEFDSAISKIDAYKKLQRSAAIAENSLKTTNERIIQLQRMKDAGFAVEVTGKEISRLKEKSVELSSAVQRLKGHEIDLRTALKMANVDTNNLSISRQHLSAASSSATMNSMRLQAALDAENQKMKRLHAAQADLAKSKELAGKLAMRGAGITAAGAAGGAVVGKTIKDFADFETAMLGVARQMDGARDDGGKVTKTYWEMATAIKAMSERLPGTASDIAKIVEGGARMGIQGKENLLIFAETTAVMSKAFDLPVDQIGEDIGKISQLYKVPIKDIKQLGDTINFLDDNALAKGADIIDVMKRIAGTADMANMSFKDAAALGSTFLSLGAKAEVAASASNAMIRELSVANMQSKRFKEGMAMIGMNGKDVQSSMNKDATGTIIKVLEKIKSLAGDKQLEAATRLFGKEYGDDAAKLASNLDEYRRQLQLVRDQKAMGSMQREADAWGDTLNARIENAKDAFANLSSDLGQSFKPAVAATLERTLGMVQAVRAWSAENPALSSGLMTALKWLAGTLTVLGGLTMAAGAVLVPLAAMKFSLVTLGITGSGAMAMLTTALSAVGGAISFVGRAMLLNPIGLTLTAIATAATLIYVYWGPITAFFSNLWRGISTAARLGWEEIKGVFNDTLNFFSGIGTAIVDGIWAGLSSGWAWMVEKVKGLAELLPQSVRDVLGIHSPSRVFAEIGMHTIAGLEQGIDGNEDGPIKAIGNIAKKMAAVGAGVAISTSPIAAGAAGTGSATASGNTYQIIINAPAGTDNQGLASLIAREIERIENSKAARSRSRLRDSE